MSATRGRTRTLALSAVLTVLVTSGALTALPAGAQPRPATATSAEPGGRPESHTVRLVTGDRVTVTRASPDAEPTVEFDSVDGARGEARVERTSDRITVVPAQAEPFLAAGQLDRRLFDVSGLIEQGYDDGADLPLIVRYGKGTPAAKGETFTARRTRTLPPLNAQAVKVTKATGGKFWKGLTGRAGSPGTHAPGGLTATERTTPERAGAHSTAPGPDLAGDVTKVWLDAKVEANLAQSVPQIGAPEAWKAGLDGKGVKVAVLDTGTDPNHPDLAGRVAVRKDFTGESPDTVDGHGHGTHVAGTVAGSGAASGGKNKGVAPEADLLIGKVLTDSGGGSTSSVIGGMQWAVDSGARVVSMSLGGAPTDGTDPLSQALNTMSEQSGALFVVAAGNDGRTGDYTVGAPGAADAALTVAAVDKKDTLADFSGRGPRTGNNAFKPDIAAPGVDIVAPRAAGTAMGTPVDASYTSASGTSMATPHVAGAAAILAQEHPDWKAPQLKRALMSSAKVLPGTEAFGQGSGRVDVAAAVKQTLWSARNASFGAFTEGAQAAPVTRTLTFGNDTDRPVTLDLAANFTEPDGDKAPDGMLTLGADSLTVPAGGQQDVQVTLTPGTSLTEGTWTGTVTGTTGDGARVHATVGAYVREAQFPVRIKVIDRDGKPAHGSFELFSRERQFWARNTVDHGNGTLTVMSPRGRFSIMGRFATADGMVYAAEPDVTVTDGPLDLTFDARDAEQVRPITPKPSDQRGVALQFLRDMADASYSRGITWLLGQLDGHVYAVESKRAQQGKFGFQASWYLNGPQLTATATVAAGRRVPLDVEISAGALEFEGRRSARLAYAGDGSAADLAAHPEVRGAYALIRQGNDYDEWNARIARALDAGATGVVLAHADDNVFGSPTWTGGSVPVFTIGASQAGKLTDALTAGQDVTLDLTSTLRTPYTYDIAQNETGRIGTGLTHRYTDDELAAVRTEISVTAPASARSYSNEAVIGMDPVSGLGGAAAPRYVPMPLERVSYLSTDNVGWMRRIKTTLADRGMMSPLRQYEPGRTTERWYAAVLHPGIPAGRAFAQGRINAPTRTEDGLAITLTRNLDGPGVRAQYTNPVDGDTFVGTLYADGRQVGEPIGSTSLRFAGLPAGRVDYRLVTEAGRTADWARLSTRTRTEWTFTSARPAAGTTSSPTLLQADYRLPTRLLDLDNTLPTGRTVPFTVAFHDVDGKATPLARSRFQVSYDDGKTWRPLPGRVMGAAASLRLKAPVGADFASLRVFGEDREGNGVDQTVIRAVGLR